MNINPLTHEYKLTEKQQKDKLMDACAEFESYFYKLIMKTGRAGGFESDLIKKSNAENIFTDMLDGEISKLAANKTKGGLKELLFNSLKSGIETKRGNNFHINKINQIYGIT